MHFCKANEACCGEDFNLARMTDEEQKIHNELNRILLELRENPEADAAPALDKAEALKVLEDRMVKVNELMKRM